MTIPQSPSRAEWHDKAWALYQSKALDDAMLSRLSIHTIRAVFDATYDALPRNEDDEIKCLDRSMAASTKRAIDCVRACQDLSQDALDGGWTAIGMAKYARQLEDTIRVLLAAYDRDSDPDWAKGVPNWHKAWAQARVIIKMHGSIADGAFEQPPQDGRP